jgi:hypothetical protein
MEDILKTAVTSALKLISSKETIAEYWVSKESQFKDIVWNFPNPTPGARSNVSKINWGMELLDGSKLTDPQHAARLYWVRALVLTLIISPAEGRAPAPGSMGAMLAAKWLMSWMSERSYYLPAELTPTVIENYIEDLPRLILDQQDNEEIAVGTVKSALKILSYLWLQRDALRKIGILSLQEDPFFMSGVITVAEGIATKPTGGWIKPLPDEVAIPLFNKALWFIGNPAEDVIRIIAGSLPIGPNEPRKARAQRIDNFLSGFQFGVAEGDESPWHEPLDQSHVENAGKDLRMIRLRALFDSVREACTIIIQGTSGMRLSELMGISAGVDRNTGLPCGVRLEDGLSGQYEWFVIRTVLSKTEEGGGRDVDWVLGMRPKGSSELPPAVHALLVLNRLFEPWRAVAGTARLLLQGGVSAHLPLPTTALTAMSGEKCGERMKRFIDTWVDLSALPDSSKHKLEENDLVKWREHGGKNFTTHMLRKSWAAFTLAVDPRLLPAIQMQFHHLSLAMTESGYIGNNPLLIEALDSVSIQKRNLMLFELVTGKVSLAGRMGEKLEAAAVELREKVGEMRPQARWKHIAEWADSNELKMYFSEYATCCPIKTSEMRCNDAAGTPGWIRSSPNFAYREPTLCAGCSCAIMDKSHEVFWTERYVKNRLTLHNVERLGISQNLRVIRDRATQAEKVLKKFGAKVELLDDQITRMLDAGEVYA